MGNAISQIRSMAYGSKSAGPKRGSGIGMMPKDSGLSVRRSRPKRLVTALRRGAGLG